MRKTGVDIYISETVGDEIENESEDGDRKLKELKFIEKCLVPNFVEGFFQIEEHKARGKRCVIVVCDRIGETKELVIYTERRSETGLVNRNKVVGCKVVVKAGD
jgi:hypothetical protein